MVSSGVMNNAKQIYNMDESGFSTVPDDNEKVISEKNKKHIGKISSAERGTLVTVIAAISAAGSVVAPAFVFPRIRRNPALLNGMKEEYPTCKLFCSESGYSNSDIFLEWMHHFIKEVRPSKDFPVILLLDNHVSHLNYDALCLAKENFVHMLTIPPHSSHEVQPLDVGFFSPLKTYWGQAVNDYLMLHPGETVSINQFCSIFKPAYKKVLHPDYGINAFAKTGICPFDRNKFTETMYLPSAVTNQNPNEQNKEDLNSEDENEGMDGVHPLPGSEIDVHLPPGPEEVVGEAEVIQQDVDFNATPGLSQQNVSEVDSDQFVLDIPIINIEDLDEELRNELVEFDSMSDPTTVVKMLDIYAYPKIKKNKKRSGRAIQAAIVTSSPELLKIKRKKEETEAKKELMRERKEKSDQKKLEAAKKLILAEAKKIKENEIANKKDDKKKLKRTGSKKNSEKGESTNGEKENPSGENEKLDEEKEKSDAENEKLNEEKENHKVEKQKKSKKVAKKPAAKPGKKRKIQRRLFDKNDDQETNCICPACNIVFEDPPVSRLDRSGLIISILDNLIRVFLFTD